MEPYRNDQGNIGFGILGFCFPIVGLVLYLVWKDEKPGDAKMAGMGALISVIIGVAFYVISFIIGIAAMGMTSLLG